MYSLTEGIEMPTPYMQLREAVVRLDEAMNLPIEDITQKDAAVAYKAVELMTGVVTARSLALLAEDIHKVTAGHERIGVDAFRR